MLPDGFKCRRIGCFPEALLIEKFALVFNSALFSKNTKMSPEATSQVCLTFGCPLLSFRGFFLALY